MPRLHVYLTKSLSSEQRCRENGWTYYGNYLLKISDSTPEDVSADRFTLLQAFDEPETGVEHIVWEHQKGGRGGLTAGTHPRSEFENGYYWTNLGTFRLSDAQLAFFDRLDEPTMFLLRDANQQPYVSPPISDKAEAITMVQTGGQKLRLVSDALRNDKEVALAAVRNQGKALQFASDALRADPEVVAEAVKSDGEAVQFALGDAQSAAAAQGAFPCSCGPCYCSMDRPMPCTCPSCGSATCKNKRG